jgi:hypothetical protein
MGKTKGRRPDSSLFALHHLLLCYKWTTRQTLIQQIKSCIYIKEEEEEEEDGSSSSIDGRPCGNWQGHPPSYSTLFVLQAPYFHERI